MCSVSTAERPRARAGTRSLAPILVLGLGNPLLGDDGVGWRVVERLAVELSARHDSERRGGAAPELDYLAVGGLTLMERIVGYEQVVLVDALSSGHGRPGTVTCGPLSPDLMRAAGHLDSAHDVTLGAALDAGRALGASLPGQIMIVGVEAERVDVFGDALSPAVERAVPGAVECVMALLASDQIWS